MISSQIFRYSIEINQILLMWFRDGHILQNAQGPVICNVTILKSQKSTLCAVLCFHFMKIWFS